MTLTLAPDSAARLLVHRLVRRGIDTFFGIPGGPIAPVFEAVRLDPGARLIESRHETYAAFAACGYYHSTGKVSVLLVTAGPGITNAVTGICQAHLHNVSLLIICGDVSLHPAGLIKIQDSGQSGIDVTAMLSNITRASISITTGRTAVPRTPAALAKATDPAHPGPALVVLPIECSSERVDNFEIAEPRHNSLSLTSNPSSVQKTATWLAAAKHPLVVVGAGCFRHHEKIATLVDTLCVPFVTTPNARGLISEEHEVFNRNLSTTIGIVADVGLFAESLCRENRLPPGEQASRIAIDERSSFHPNRRLPIV